MRGILVWYFGLIFEISCFETKAGKTNFLFIRSRRHFTEASFQPSFHSLGLKPFHGNSLNFLVWPLWTELFS